MTGELFVSDPHGCNNCGKSIIDPNANLSVGCDRGDMDMVACKHQNYLYRTVNRNIRNSLKAERAKVAELQERIDSMDGYND